LPKPYFIITIDTEGDNLWSRPELMTTENRRFIPRFQQLCEQYGFKPTYLTNYEMVADDEFVKMAKEWVANRTAEIGLHIHAWDTPPLDQNFGSRFHHVYQSELPDDLLRAKTFTVHSLLSERFGIQPVSHRAGRWGISPKVIRLLLEMGYLIDCSVAPGETFIRHKGLPTGKGGPDFSGYPITPYMLDPFDLSLPGNSNMLEVPATIKPNYPSILQGFHNKVHAGLVGKAVRAFAGEPFLWLRPTGKNLEALFHVVDWGVDEQLPVLEFVLHSSELMPGGSPRFKDNDDIEQLYSHLKQLFKKLEGHGIKGVTLAEYRQIWNDNVA